MTVAIEHLSATDLRGSSAGFALWLARLTALAALAELVLLRLATRTAIHIPGIDRVAFVYNTVADAGRLGNYLAAVLLAAALGVVAVALNGQGRPVAAASVGTMLVAAGAGRVGWLTTEAVNAVVVVGVVALAVGIARRLTRAARLPVVLYAAAFALALPPAGEPAVLGAEVAAVASMLFLAPWALRRADRLTLGVGAAVAAVTLAALLLSPSTTKILLLWNAGLTGALPAVVYAIGFGVVAATIVRLWRSGRVAGALGLCLLVEAGVGLHSSYQSGLVILGLAVLTLDPVEEGPTALPMRSAAAASSR